MAKTKASSIILIALGAGIVTILIPIVLAIALGMLFPDADTYLLTGFLFFLLGSIALILIPAVLLIVISVKSKEKGVIKRFCKDYKAVALTIAVPIVIFEIALVSGGYSYFKDIQAGPQEAIMTDAELVRRSSGKYGGETYLEGYIDGEKTRLDLTGDANDAVNRGKKYKKLKIRYYENIAEVFEIDVVYGR